MRVELIEEVEDDVSIDRRCYDDHVLLVLGPMAAVCASLLLSLYPRVRQLLELWWRNTNTDGHMVTYIGGVNYGNTTLHDKTLQRYNSVPHRSAQQELQLHNAVCSKNDYGGTMDCQNNYGGTC